MSYRTEVMAMAQEAGLGQLLPATATQPAEWYGSRIESLEKLVAFAITAERERVSREAAQRECEQ